MGKKLAIKGHSTRGNEVIELLEMMGGKNCYNLNGLFSENAYYVIGGSHNDEILGGEYMFGNEDIYWFTLEKFLEKYPFKVGDKVTLDNKLCSIIWMCWECNNIYYQVQGIDDIFTKKVTADELKPYKETNIDGDNYCETLDTKVFGYKVGDIIFTNNTGWIRITNKLWDCYSNEYVYEGIGIINEREYKDIRNHNVTGKIELGHLKYCKDVDDIRCVNSITDDIMINQITNKVSVIKLKPDVCDNKIELQLGNYEIVVNDGKTYAVLKKPTYPKTYRECFNVCFGNKHHIIQVVGLDGDNKELFESFIKLKICRDAYWKIYGEQISLGKPWEPNWTTFEGMPAIFRFKYNIVCDFVCDSIKSQHCLLVFPTAEMRNSFYENFKDLIEQCKELL